MAKAKLPVTAACVCGKIELCADEQPLVVYLCHCMRCQTTSGTDYQHNARFEPGQLSVTKGKDDIVSVRIAGAPVKRHYCGNCHVRVFHERLDTFDNIDKQVLPVGIVTSGAGAADPAWQPAAHAWYGNRARDILDDIPKWQGFVEDSERWQQRAEAPEVAAAAAPLPPGDERPLPKPPTTFACHCGATELEASAEPLNSYYCHCTSCRKLCGSDFAHNCQFEPDQLRVTKGADKLLSYRKEGSPRVTFNCGICYDRMYRQTEATDGSVLMKVAGIGTIVDKDKAAWQPRWHIWCSERACDMQDGLQKWSETKDTSELMQD